MRSLIILQAPSPLGVAPHGIEKGGDALLRAGLAERIGAELGARIEPAPFDWRRDPDDGLLNRQAISDYRVTPLAGIGLLFVLVGNLLVFARWRRRPMPEVPAAKV